MSSCRRIQDHPHVRASLPVQASSAARSGQVELEPPAAPVNVALRTPSSTTREALARPSPSRPEILEDDEGILPELEVRALVEGDGRARLLSVLTACRFLRRMPEIESFQATVSAGLSLTVRLETGERGDDAGCRGSNFRIGQRPRPQGPRVLTSHEAPQIGPGGKISRGRRG